MSVNNGNFAPLVPTISGNYATFLTPCIDLPYDPAEKDQFFQLFQPWRNSTSGDFFVYSGAGEWTQLVTGAGSGIQTITGNSGGAAGPDGSGNFNVVGTGGVSVTTDPTTNTATISASSSGITWTDKTTSFTATVDEAYFLNSALTLTLPASPSQGSFIYVIVAAGTTGYNVAANTGQKIRIGTGVTSTGGNAANTALGDSLELYFQASSSTWFSNSTSSTWTLT